LKTDTHRAGQYNAKYVAATVGLKVAQRLTGMKASYADVAQSLVPKEVATQAILNGSSPAISTCDYPFYMAYCRQLWKLSWNGISGAAATAEAQALHDKWESTGLATAVLIAIAGDVFGITVT
jgi:hypothetical protein